MMQALILAAVSAFATLAQAQTLKNPLSNAAYEATRRCAVVAPGASIDTCGTVTPGATPAHTAARKAARVAYEQRQEFMNTCVTSYSLENCSGIANAMIDEGRERALAEK